MASRKKLNFEMFFFDLLIPRLRQNFLAILTLVVVLFIELLSKTSYRLPNPDPILLFLVILSAFFGGFFKATIVSLVITLFYSLLYYSKPGEYFVYDFQSYKTLVVLFSTLISSAILVSLLNRRNQELLEDKIEKQNEVKYQKQIYGILESITDGFFALNKNLRFTYINNRADTFFYRKKRLNLIGKYIWDEFPIQPTISLQKKFQRSIRYKKPLVFEEYFPKELKYYHFRIYPNPSGISVYFNDITNQKRTEERLRRLAVIVKTAEDAIYAKSLDGVILSWNKGAEKTFGYSSSEMIGKNVSILFPKEKLQELKDNLLAIKKGKALKRLESKRITKSGKIIDVSVSISPIKDKKNKVIGASTIARDVSQRKEIEREVRQSRNQLEIIFQNVADGITVQNKEGKVIFVNDQGAQLTGFKDGKEMMDLYKKMGRVNFTKKYLSQFELKDEQGNKLTLQDLPAYQVMRGLPKSERIVNYLDKKTNKSYWSNIKASPVYGDDGTIQYVVNIFSDITSRKEAEVRKDEFIGIASHELKTPLTSIKGFAYLLQKQLKKFGDRKAQLYADKINIYSDKINKLISDLLDVSRIHSGKMVMNREKILFDDFIKNVVEDLRASTETHMIETIGSSNAKIEGDKLRLEQVLTNLINNAVKYSPNADRVVVRIDNKNNQVICGVQDFGVGIPQSKLRHIFERFYRVEETSKQFTGLGIGLFISSEIVKRHAGNIWVESEFRKGSTFYFALPIVTS